MNKEWVADELLKAEAKVIQMPDGAIYSVDPPETLFGFLYHSHMIPPFAPDHTLILGYGGGTVAALMRKIWGTQLRITGVDLIEYPHTWMEYKFVKADAWKYIKDCTTGLFKTKFDYICVDLWNGDKVPEIVFTHEFAVRLRQMAKRMICMNIQRDQMFLTKKFLEDYGGFVFERGDLVGGNIVLWWSVPQQKGE